MAGMVATLSEPETLVFLRSSAHSSRWLWRLSQILESAENDINIGDLCGEAASRAIAPEKAWRMAASGVIIFMSPLTAAY